MITITTTLFLLIVWIFLNLQTRSNRKEFERVKKELHLQDKIRTYAYHLADYILNSEHDHVLILNIGGFSYLNGHRYLTFAEWDKDIFPQFQTVHSDLIRMTNYIMVGRNLITHSEIVRFQGISDAGGISRYELADFVMMKVQHPLKVVTHDWKEDGF